MGHPDTTAPASEPTIAVVGSGPAGCYTAQFLRKKWKGAEVVVFDRLALPYGLVRYGVAPDHQGTKAVTKQFDRLFERDGVQFAGGTEIGTDITLEALREAFDIVVLATGLPADRALDGIDDSLSGVYGAGAVTRLINGHPHETAETLKLGGRVTIVGQGNVAIDLVRLFLTPSDQLRALGVADAVVDAIAAGPVRSIEIVGRSSVESAKFDVAMVRELARLDGVDFRASGPGFDTRPVATTGEPQDARREAITELVAASFPTPTRSVHFRFGWTPERVTGTTSVDGIVFRASDGTDDVLILEADSVCTAIGFAEIETAPVRRISHETPESDLSTGYLDSGLYCVGWLRRGPQGTIPANRADARLVADGVIAAVDTGTLPLGKPGRAALDITSPSLVKEFS